MLNKIIQTAFIIVLICSGHSMTGSDLGLEYFGPKSDTIYRIINVRQGCPLDMDGKMQKDTQHNHPENHYQQWMVKRLKNGDSLLFKFINRKTNTPLDINGVQPDIIHNHDSNGYQKWQLLQVPQTNYYVIKNYQTGFHLDVNGLQDDIKHNSLYNQYQQWYFQPVVKLNN
jgi:hypothetical protein